MTEETDSRTDEQTYFHLLGEPRRRSIIRHLDKHDFLDKGELAVLVASDDEQKPASQVTNEERKRAYISNKQHHLPALEEAGVITRSGENDTIIQQGPIFDIFAMALRNTASSDAIQSNTEN